MVGACTCLLFWGHPSSPGGSQPEPWFRSHKDPRCRALVCTTCLTLTQPLRSSTGGSRWRE